MDYNEQILFEQRIKGILMEESEFNKCLNILLTTKDIEDSVYNDRTSNTKVLQMIFKKENEKSYSFEGMLSISKKDIVEYKNISGQIMFKKNRIYVLSDVTFMDKDHFNYEVVDLFEKKKDKTIRTSYYQYIEKPFVNEVNFMTEEELENYKKDFVETLKK